jgi:hypothetical protein
LTLELVKHGVRGLGGWRDRGASAAGNAVLTGRFWELIAKLNDNFGMLGYGIIVLFAVSWILSVIIYKWRRFDDLEFGARDTA